MMEYWNNGMMGSVINIMISINYRNSET
jgi:hypothetical protein